jgi:NADH dehydrogenase/NADH:ubiquinone oxidoreductase subunit G
MSDIQFEIDGKKVSATPDMTVLEVAQKEGIYIPTLCHHEKLEPFGACRICIVEVESRGATKSVVSCV